RTAGTYVSAGGSPLARRERVKILTERIDALLAEARQLGIDADEVVELLRRRDEAMLAPARKDKGEAMVEESPAIAIEGVTRRFGRKAALDDVSLEVPRGVVFGLVGENGAGKTTLVKHVLGLLKAQAGRVRVFGRDPVKEPVAVLSRVGYLSEERDL